jgi:hypothetical protein
MSEKIRSGRIAERRQVHAVDRRYKPQQIDLFERDACGGMIGAPAWLELPGETQSTLMSLMARLILEHADKNRTGSMPEAGHDL